MNIYIVFGIIWLLSGILSHGMDFAYYQRKYPEVSESNYRIQIILSLTTNIITGLLGLTISIIGKNYKYGLKFW